MGYHLCQSNNLFHLSQEEMKSLGYKAIDAVVEHLMQLPSKTVANMLDYETLKELRQGTFSTTGAKSDDVIAYLQEKVFTNITHVDHPRFFAFVPGPSNYVSVIGDLLATGFNVFTGSWIEAAAASEIELSTIQWLTNLFGYGEQAGGLFVSGGSLANLSAVALAKEVKLNNHIQNSVIYFSDQTHSSVEKCLRILGFQKDQMRKIPVDNGFCMNVHSLEAAITDDLQKGHLPFCVVANGGTTNTGAVDPLEKVAAVCQQYQLWFHVDGAYGGALILSSQGKKLLQGIQYADSITIDPHKWLFQPYEMGCILVKDSTYLPNLFRIMPEYLEDIYGIDHAVNLCDYGIQLTRNFKALKLWFSLKVYGVELFYKAVQRGLDLAQYTEDRLRRSGYWQIVSPATAGIVTFYYKKPDLSLEILNQFNKNLVDKLVKTGFAMISTTKLNNILVLRMCTINPQTTEQDITETIDLLENLAVS